MPAVTIIQIMDDPAAILRLLTWFSPGFPTGAYAYSHGLEWAVAAGDVSDGATLGAWLEDLLVLGSGRSDAILLRHAHRAVSEVSVIAGLDPAIPGLPAHGCLRPGMTGIKTETTLAEIAKLAAAAAPCRERRAETLDLGTAFAAAAVPWSTLSPAAYPVVVGALTGQSGISEDSAVTAYLQAFAANLSSAGVRLIPLGQSAGLAVLAAMEPIILAMVRETRVAGLDDIGGACFRSDIAAMRHETQYTRLFRT
jgi:urease accessory protein